jgi:tRNA nucleotidyltransferase/poly(A) polymerase
MLAHGCLSPSAPYNHRMGDRDARLLALLSEPAVRQTAAFCAADTCHIVGGTLRDAWLEMPSADLDLVVAGSGRALAAHLAAVLPARLVNLGGKDFAAFRLVTADRTIDLWDRAATSLDADLARRDFTINALALPCAGGELIDPFAGRADLSGRCLRATTTRSFREDPLRLLRLARLRAQLPGFAVDPGTRSLATSSVPGLLEVAAERIRCELELLLSLPHAAEGFAELVATGVFPYLWPNAPGSPPPPLQELDHALAELRRLGAPVVEAALVETRFAVIFQTIKPLETARRTVEHWREVGYLSHRGAAHVLALLGLTTIPDSTRERRRYLHAGGPVRWTAALAVAGAVAASQGAETRWGEGARATIVLALDEGAEVFSPPRLLHGEEVQNLLGMTPGPRLGEALAALRAAQVEGEVRTREQAVAWLLGAYSSTRSASISEK